MVIFITMVRYVEIVLFYTQPLFQISIECIAHSRVTYLCIMYETNQKTCHNVEYSNGEDMETIIHTNSKKVMLYGDDPFKIINPGNTSELSNVNERSVCVICGKSRMYYCYTCYIPLAGTRHIIPTLTQSLPCKIDIIKHPREVDGKSTAAHAKVICPSDVQIFTYPDIPDYETW